MLYVTQWVGLGQRVLCVTQWVNWGGGGHGAPLGPSEGLFFVGVRAAFGVGGGGKAEGRFFRGGGGGTPTASHRNVGRAVSPICQRALIKGGCGDGTAGGGPKRRVGGRGEVVLQPHWGGGLYGSTPHPS